MVLPNNSFEIFWGSFEKGLNIFQNYCEILIIDVDKLPVLKPPKYKCCSHSVAMLVLHSAIFFNK